MIEPTVVPSPALPADAPPSSQPPLAAAAQKLDPRDRGVTPRVVVFSLTLALLLGYLVPVIDYKYMNTFLGGTHLPPGAIGALLILVLVINPLLGLVSKGLRFSRNEALTVYISCLFSCLVPGHGSENFIVPNLLAPFYFANSNNKWFDFLLGNLKPWLTPALNHDGTINHAVLDNWYQGGPVPWAAWIVPMAFWVTLVFAVYAMLGCLSAMLRAQWVEHEALAFPLLRLPLQMTEGMEGAAKTDNFFRNPLMWTGFGVAVFIEMLRGLHIYFPDVPTFPLELDTGPLLREAPWNQIGWTPLQIFPLVVGISYLLTSEVSFSLWFFFWLLKFEKIGVYYLGYPAATLPGASSSLPNAAIFGFQMAGCYLAFVGFVLWSAREHFRHIALRAFGKVPARESEEREVMSYPLAFWGFLGATALVVGLTCLAGVRLDLALVLWAGYLVFAIGLSRVAVEGGMLSLLTDSAPLGIAGRLVSARPAAWLSTQAGVVPASFVQAGFAVHMRGFIMPSYLHAWKLAHERGIAPRKLALLIVFVVLISCTMGMQMAVRLGYENGGLSLTHKWWATVGSKWPANFVSAMMSARDNSPLANWCALALGAALTFGMIAMRARYAGFPFHPIGYLMCQTFPAYMFWFSIMLGWLAKSLITRFGGTDTYRKGTAFFLGLALGDVAMMLFWLIVDSMTGGMSHSLMPQ